MRDKRLGNHLCLSKRRVLVQRLPHHGWEQRQPRGHPARRPSALPRQEPSIQPTSSPFDQVEINRSDPAPLFSEDKKGEPLEKCRVFTQLHGGTTILWHNPIFHNFQGNCTEARKTTSPEACNSSVLPAYHLNKSVSGETKDKEKLPVVPDSSC